MGCSGKHPKTLEHFDAPNHAGRHCPSYHWCSVTAAPNGPGNLRPIPRRLWHSAHFRHRAWLCPALDVYNIGTCYHVDTDFALSHGTAANQGLTASPGREKVWPPMNSSSDILMSLARQVVDLALKKGVDVAEVSAGQGWELSAKVRLGEVELVEEAGHKSLSLRVRRNDRVAASSTSDLRLEGLQQCVGHAAELLELSEPDPDSRPADPSEHCKNTNVDLGLFDESLEQLDTDQAIKLA